MSAGTPPVSDRELPLLAVRRRADGWSVRTPAKINLFLEVHGRRPDGFHEITSLFAPIEFFDRIQVEPAKHDSLEVVGEDVPGDEENLVWKALTAYRTLCAVPPLAMRLQKNIPPGSGLGGGSGDAAGMLALLARAYPLPEVGLIGARATLERLALGLGSDVAFFFGEGAAVVRGRGEIIIPFEGLWGGERPWILLILPRVEVLTRDVYARVTFPLTSPDGPISFAARTFRGSLGADPRGSKESPDRVRAGRLHPGQLHPGQMAGGQSRPWTSGQSASGQSASGLFNRLGSALVSVAPRLRVLHTWLSMRAPQRWCVTGSGAAAYVVCPTRNEALALGKGLRRDALLAELGIRTRLTRILHPRTRQ